MENLDLNISEYTQEDFDEVKELFKEKYAASPFNFELKEEHARELLFYKNQYIYKLEESELKSYIDYQKGSYKNKPFETCLINNEYFEQSIVLSSKIDEFFLRRSNKVIQWQKGEIQIKISPASSDFQNHHRFSELSLPKLNFRSMSMLLMEQKHNGFIHIDQFLYMPMTIKVFNLNSLFNLDKINELIESCLFDYAVTTGVTWELQETLPSNKKFKGRNKTLRESNYNQIIKKYNLTLLQYFKQGMLYENNPVYQFLSFYHVLEYFFVLVSDEILYKNLSSLINQPNFTTDTKNLDQIIKVVNKHRTETNEDTMLKEVLQKYITDYSKEKLVEFIQNYPFTDNKQNSWLLMKKNDDFEKAFYRSGKEQYQAINIESEQVLAYCAKRIKIVRNALVHSSDRHERQERFIPTRQNKQLLEKEIPLVKFLAEQIIIASAE